MRGSGALDGNRPAAQGLVHWSWIIWGALIATATCFALAFHLGLISRVRTSPSVNLVDPRFELIEGGAVGWDYRRSFEADLNEDGRPETIEILARVSRDSGRGDDYQWDDGQPWQVYVREGDQLTHIYARWVQLGHISVYVTDEPHPRLMIAEAQGAGYALYSVVYKGPGQFETTMVTEFPVRDGA